MDKGIALLFFALLSASQGVFSLDALVSSNESDPGPTSGTRLSVESVCVTGAARARAADDSIGEVFGWARTAGRVATAAEAVLL